MDSSPSIDVLPENWSNYWGQVMQAVSKVKEELEVGNLDTVRDKISIEL